MKKVHIWLFIINLFTPLCSSTAQELVQEVEEAVKEELVDTLNKEKKKSIPFALV